jgi:hypothetical protein
MAARAARLPLRDIARLFVSRTLAAIAARATTLEERSADAAEDSARLAKVRDRTCLCCSGMFPSHGPGNRLCSRCAQNASRIDESAWIPDNLAP